MNSTTYVLPEDLAHGQLSSILLPPEILESTLTDINTELRHRLRVSTSVTILVENTPAAYYRSHNFVAARQGANLLIAVNFPLSVDNLDMTLYKVQTFPHPVPGDLNIVHVTVIQNMPYGIGFKSSADDYEYLIFKTKPDLTGNYFYFNHNSTEPLRLFSRHHTCISAIIQNRRSLITQHCEFQLRPESLMPNILPLSPSTILITNITSLTFRCSHRRKSAKGCLQCRISLPCHCSIHSQHGFIPARSAKCTPAQQNITIQHTVNLAVLQSFFEDNILGSLLGDTPLSKQLPVHLPEFRIFKANDTSRLAHDSQFSYDLDKAINITKADSKVFHSLAETLWRDVMNTNKDISDYPSIQTGSLQQAIPISSSQLLHSLQSSFCSIVSNC